MKYTFEYKGKQKTIDIPQEYIDQQKRSLGPSTSIKEIIDLYLFDNGYESNAEVDALNAKAGSAGIRNKAEGKPRKAPQRKPDETKRELIALLADAVNTYAGVKELTTANIERTITFSLGEDKYEITLSKKRKPKQ